MPMYTCFDCLFLPCLSCSLVFSLVNDLPLFSWHVCTHLVPTLLVSIWLGVTIVHLLLMDHLAHCRSVWSTWACIQSHVLKKDGAQAASQMQDTLFAFSNSLKMGTPALYMLGLP